jgi:hypothetical protein
MSGSQIVKRPTLIDVFGSDSLILVVKLDLKEEFWNLPGGTGERPNMFVLQPSEGTVSINHSSPSGVYFLSIPFQHCSIKSHHSCGY